MPGLSLQRRLAAGWCLRFSLFCYALCGCGRVGIQLLPLVEDGAINPTGVVDSGAPDVCPTTCENPHGGASCATGTCLASCATGFADCDSTPTNGCETDISQLQTRCGSCGLSCINDHGTTACAAGICTPVCQSGFEDCDRDRSNGCEAELATTSHCGACAVSCTNPNGTTSCSAGKCLPSCAPTHADCDGDPSNGCETNTSTDPAHCGSCGQACGTNGQICVAGGCAASPCAAGRGECDQNLAVTCETDLSSSLANCGFCGNLCTAANGTPACTASSCRIAACNASRADCDALVSNGCEVDLTSDTAHCGSCATSCSNAHGTSSCNTSACVPSCSTGYGNCDGNAPNGCETALNTVSNCGTCGKTCPLVAGGTPTCSAGICGASCDLTGTFALQIVMQTSWANATYISGGSGPHVFWLKMQGTQSGNSVAESIVECGRSVPDFRASMVSETYNFSLPTSLFDGVPTLLPSYAVPLTLGATSPGASVTLPTSAFLLGTSLTNPTTAAWPSTSAGLTQLDMDADGNAGVTVNYLNGGGRSYPLTGPSLGASRAQQPYSATRLVFSLNGTLSSCTQSAGTAIVTHVDTRIFGCKLTSGSKCNASQASFLDTNCVKYNLGSATYKMLKVADTATCADVRAALP